MFKKIAVVGISDKEDRDSFKVAKYLHEHGFNVIPVNPVLKQWLGIKEYANLKDAASIWSLVLLLLTHELFQAPLQIF